jgi:hypothetical protein
MKSLQSLVAAVVARVPGIIFHLAARAWWLGEDIIDVARSVGTAIKSGLIYLRTKVLPTSGRLASSSFNRHCVTFLCAALIIGTFYNIDQINHLFTSTHSLDKISLVIAIIWLNAAAYSFVMQWPQWGLRNRGRLLAVVSLIALLLALFGLAMSSVRWYYAVPANELQRPWVDTSFISGIAITLVGCALIWTVSKVFDPRHQARSVDLLLRVIAASWALSVVDEVAWEYFGVVGGWAPRPYSIGAACHIAFMLLCLVAVWEAWVTARVSQPTLTTLATSRGIAILIPVGLVLTCALRLPQLQTPVVGRLEKDGITTADEHSWLRHLMTRLQRMQDDNEPIVFVAASGGGSRAAVFAALVYKDSLTSGIEYTGEAEARKYNVATHLAVISSVSGGSLASACFVNKEYGPTITLQPPNAVPAHFDMDAVLAGMGKYIYKLSDQRFRDTHSGVGDVDKLRSECRRHVSLGIPWDFQESRFLDDMCSDFMAPLLRAVLLPGEERGSAVSRFWESSFGLTGTNLQRRRDVVWSENVPMLLCNATDVSSGKVLVMGYPELDPGILSVGNSTGVLNDVERGTADLHIGELPLIGLADINPLQPRCSLTLAEMVRLSANFPWGFQVARLPVQQAGAAGVPPTAVDVIDGGVLDNTGLTTLRCLLERIDEMARSPIASSERADAQAALEMFRDRGVLLLEIAAGAKQSEPEGIARTFSGIVEPVTAFTNATYSVADALRNQNIAAIRRLLWSRKSADITRGIAAALSGGDDNTAVILPGSLSCFYHVTVECNEDENVMTAWALSNEDIAKVFMRFVIARKELHCRLHDALETNYKVQTELTKLRALALGLRAQGNKPNREVQKQVVERYVRTKEIAEAFDARTRYEIELHQLYAKGGSKQEIDAVAARKKRIDRPCQTD